MSKVFKKFFDYKKNVNNTNKNTENLNNEGFKMNIKGQRVAENFDGPNLNLANLDRDLYRKEKGPPMLNMQTRFRVWRALFGVGVYFYLCYRLILYRLKSDDLDLMEREVNEQFKLKKKVQEFNSPISK
jgi:hypothetical protein